MTEKQFIGAIDQGTTSSRFLIFDDEGKLITFHQVELAQSQPHSGWLEHDPLLILDTVLECIEKTIKRFELMGHHVKDIKAIGVTNQRESAVAWNKRTGEPLRNTIVWSDVRTDDLVHDLKEKEKKDGNDIQIQDIAGLSLSSYFTAVKFRWMLDHDEKVKEAVKAGEACLGTVDSWLIYKLTNHSSFVTDVTNASRTLLMNLKTLNWDDDLLRFFDIDKELLPTLCSSSEIYGKLEIENCALKGIPISGCLGDQQAALLGQKCFSKGEAKCTFGTGAFMLFNTGEDMVKSKHGLIMTIAFKLGKEAKATYALEGSVAVAGSSLRWLRDNLRLINSMEEVSELAKHVPDTGGVYFVTAFSGLFAPYWRDDARGTMIGLTSYTNKYHLARATLESMSYQSKAILDAMNQDAGVPLKVLKVDGGVSNSDIAMQIQADILGIHVERPSMRETTALGTAIAAGLAVGVWKDIDELKEKMTNGDDVTTFIPNTTTKEREEKYKIWKKAVDTSLHWTNDVDNLSEDDE
ncbi:putative glycerol kinase [Cokeromyces recurvatus]|uniref:putative glycerol kinase n=1 Tax=Cokeromyces recurvatus TaxID=90255 RepID=UPI002220DCF5|nr:putative glycerol kinase [Cokeromyces recurvatus]KAI7898971.1 putative glycerol kinase [Cokeromyces recurvatus]